MKKNLRGFTLIELMVILIVLAILIGVTAPSVISYMQRADQRECDTNIAMIEGAAAAELKITPTLKDAVIADPSSVFSVIEGGEKLRTSCPCGGDYTAKYDSANKRILIICSFHDSKPVSSYQTIINTIKSDYMKNHSYLSGSMLNDLFKEENGGTLPTAEVDGKTFFIKGNTAPGFSSPLLYLSNNAGSNSWYGFYFYDSDNDQWYVSAKIHAYTKKPEEVCITNKSSFENAIANGQLVPTDNVL